MFEDKNSPFRDLMIMPVKLFSDSILKRLLTKNTLNIFTFILKIDRTTLGSGSGSKFGQNSGSQNIVRGSTKLLPGTFRDTFYRR